MRTTCKNQPTVKPLERQLADFQRKKREGNRYGNDKNRCGHRTPAFFNDPTAPRRKEAEYQPEEPFRVCGAFHRGLGGLHHDRKADQ